MARPRQQSSSSPIDAAARTDGQSQGGAAAPPYQAQERKEENYAQTAREFLKPGRKSSITDEVINTVAANVAMGMPEEFACLEAGVSYDAFKKAQQRSGVIVLAQKRAQATYMKLGLQQIQMGLPGWQGAAWILERRHKAHFSKTENNVTQNITNNFSFSPEDMQEMRAMAQRNFVLADGHSANARKTEGGTDGRKPQRTKGK